MAQTPPGGGPDDVDNRSDVEAPAPDESLTSEVPAFIAGAGPAGGPGEAPPFVDPAGYDPADVDEADDSLADFSGLSSAVSTSRAEALMSSTRSRGLGEGGMGGPAFGPESASGFSEGFGGVQDLARQLGAARMPPHSLEAEQAVLGGLLVALSDGFDRVSDIVTEFDFYDYHHRLIYRAIAAIVTDNGNCDVVTVVSWLDKNGLLADAHGLDYIAALPEVTPSATNIKAYASIVRERSVMRQLIKVATEIADSAFDSDGRSSKELLDEAETKVFAIADQSARSGGGFQDIQTILAGAIERINTLFESDASITGIATGFDDLDEKTSGLQSSDLIIIAGRPSMGKTTFAMNIAEHVALTAPSPVAVFSMEMPAEQLGMRLIASLGRVELQKLRTGRLSEQDWPRIASAITLLNQKRSVFIDDTPALTPTDLRARARRLAREHGLSLIVIDYLQLMKGSASSNETRATEISEISRSLKALAKELDVPIIALSQLNRALEQRPDKRPVMSDLRESGAIEQDADVIMFIYRDEVYNPDDEASKGRAEILIRKQRNGPIGSCMLTFLGIYTRFESFSPEIMGADFS